MRRFLVSLFAFALSVGFGSFATAATDTNARATSKATYNAAKDKAEADYKVARAKCDSLGGNAKDVCVAEAKAAEKRATAEAKAAYKNTPQARADARIDIADADYSVAKAKCGNMTGNEKDVCMKEAKAAQRKSIDQAKAEKKNVRGA